MLASAPPPQPGPLPEPKAINKASFLNHGAEGNGQLAKNRAEVLILQSSDMPPPRWRVPAPARELAATDATCSQLLAGGGPTREHVRLASALGVTQPPHDQRLPPWNPCGEQV